MDEEDAFTAIAFSNHDVSDFIVVRAGEHIAEFIKNQEVATYNLEEGK